MHLRDVTAGQCKQALARASHDVVKNPTFQAAAALSYYSILCIFPALILLSAVMAYIPVPGFFADALAAMARVVPRGTMPMVYSVLIGALGPNLRAWLSFGTVGTLWVVSSAFDEMIDALDTAYDVTEPRAMWKARLLAVGLAFVVGLVMMGAVATMIVGSHMGTWLANRMFLSGEFLLFWAIIHWILGAGFAVFAVQLIYFLAPNVKQRFLSTLPGAVLAVAGWMGLSGLLGIYFRYFENYNRLYGTLGGVMALMTWLYWGYFVFLAGGELNAELAKAGLAGLQPKDKRADSRDRAA
ncbi:MAG: YihY/virulence factor BrkB family protein [Terriglobales bacterium]